MTVLPIFAFAIPLSPAPSTRHWMVEATSSVSRRRDATHTPRIPPVRARLRVCTEQDCIQQGAYQTLARLKKEAKGKGIQVDSCPCLGMCGLGPCVSIDWDGSRMESRGGIDALDDGVVRQIVEDALMSPQSKTTATQERDPYAEQ